MLSRLDVSLESGPEENAKSRPLVWCGLCFSVLRENRDGLVVRLEEYMYTSQDS